MTIPEQVEAYNRGRDPERLAMKLRDIRKSAFLFLRGTCHLFYAGLPRDPLLSRAPVAWLCGDLHLQNMGSYKADNRLVHYDISDFDEAALGPCTWDLVRLLTSIIVAAESMKVSAKEARALCVACVDAYAATLRAGMSRWIETETAEGIIKDLLDGLSARRRVELLDARTTRDGKKRRLRVDGRKALPASEAQRARVSDFMRRCATRQPDPQFYTMHDVARRIAGTGSLGVDRFVVLVEGKGSPDRNFLLDLKQARPSSLLPHLKTRQPAWPNEAERVTQVQRRMQAVSQAFLRAVTIGRHPYVLRDLQPSEDKVDLTRGKRLQPAIGAMGQLLAWDQLRSTGRQGSAIADELIAFGAHATLRKGMVDLAFQCSARVEADWDEYRRSDLGVV